MNQPNDPFPEAAKPSKPKPGQNLPLSGFDHAVTGQRVMHQECEVRAYMHLGAEYMAELRPVGIRETQMAQRIIDLNWRLNRLVAIETNLLTFNSLAKTYEGRTDDPLVEGIMVQAYAWATDCTSSRIFEAISRYESRLTRQLIQLTREFERLQDRRLARTEDTFVLESCYPWRWYTGNLRPEPVPSTAPPETMHNPAQTCAA